MQATGGEEGYRVGGTEEGGAGSLETIVNDCSSVQSAEQGWLAKDLSG